MPNEFVARLGIIALQNSQVTGSLSTTCDSIFNGVCLGEGGSGFCRRVFRSVKNALPRVFNSCVALQNGHEASERVGFYLFKVLRS